MPKLSQHSKPWYRSKSVLSGVAVVLLAAYTAAAQQFGLPEVPEVLLGLFGAGAVYGRIAATDSIGGKPTMRVTDFILEQVKALVTRVQLPDGIKAVAPILAEFAQSDRVVTDDMRAALQARILNALRRAGLTGKDL